MFNFFILVNEYIEKSKNIWHEDYIWSEEIALNNLQNMDYDVEKALTKINEKSEEIFNSIKGIYFFP